MDQKCYDQQCYICMHVFAAGRPVLYVCRDQGDWILACGGDDHRQSPEDWKVAHIGHLLEDDTSLQTITDLQDGEQAERAAVGGQWHRGRLTD